MSIQDNKVVFDNKLKSNKRLIWLLGGIEVALTIFLGLVIATTKILSPNAESAAGVVQRLSYQGRLTDSGGTALGGTGTNYCFRFSIYDAASAGNKVWPSGTPATTTLSVVSGVFNADIGSADTLDYEFYPTSSVYLNVDVYTVTTTCTGGSWETLAPRQQILATGYSIVAENVYGDLIRTDNASSIVQIGTGAGVAAGSVKKLALDVANTAEVVGSSCSISGTIWYNSNAANTQALICENGIIHAVANSNTLHNFAYPNVAFSTLGGLISNATLSFSPMFIPAKLTATRAMILGSISANTNSSGTFSLSIALYTRTGSTLSLASSASAAHTFSSNATSVYFGLRRFSVPLNVNATPGDYWYAVWVRTSNAGSMSLAAAAGVTNQLSGNFGVATNSSRQLVVGLGIFSNASVTTAMPSSVALSNIKGGTAAGQIRVPWILFTDFDLN